ncbi:TadE family protein [Nocardioides sp. TF02-7]|uniref:TadE family protein n=1 Tax=Nocardioides sp. TF02-7 TaxID=2917724 RepID=UPI001F050D0C|nr:TadE family protein [Nocardioides sp. TF02-7]UMG91595.1 pilus assembly protein [Nocardioides sp. TF02-7]
MLVLVVLVPLVVGILQVGLVLHVRSTLAAAASEGARYAATADRGPADGVARTRAQIDEAVAGAVRARRRGAAGAGRRAARGGDHRAGGGAGARPRWTGRLVLGHRPRGGGGAGMTRRDERGSAIVELVWLGVLLLVPLLWIVLSVFEVQKGAFAVTAAARAAGRAYALAPTDAAGERAAYDVARRVLADHGLADARLRVRVTCTPFPDHCHSGTSVVTVRVESGVELPLLPEALGGGAPSFALDATHTVPIGRYQEVTGAAP